MDNSTRHLGQNLLNDRTACVIACSARASLPSCIRISPSWLKRVATLGLSGPSAFWYKALGLSGPSAFWYKARASRYKGSARAPGDHPPGGAARKDGGARGGGERVWCGG